MAAKWTFGQRLGAGFAVTVALAVATGAVGIYALRSAVASKDHVITVDAKVLIDAESLRAALERKGGAARGFLLTRQDRFLDKMRDARADFSAALERMRGAVPSPQLDAIAQLEAEHRQAIDAVIAQRTADVAVDAVAKEFEDRVQPKRDHLDTAIGALVSDQQRALESARNAASDRASSAMLLLVGIIAAAIVFGVVLAFVLARALARQIASAVGQVQSSSAELQAAANQQATAAKEAATAMNEITTTISELLATSRQIADSAQRVAQIAGQTATSARAGDVTVAGAHQSIDVIRRQVDVVVAHMLDLGKKSQQIGAVLDIVSELAEQTNILAINATIEATGAGEAGKRFGVVADEIRKLADRVGGSTKEIRGLIEDVRGAVNTAVMATESGSKSVDAGSKQFGDVATAFKQIAGMVATTTEAAREIELSTKQQATAVEQVNIAIANVAQATNETEASSGQTLATASQLAGLSQELQQLVQPQASA
jgi:CHASE3 domain sensor protein